MEEWRWRSIRSPSLWWIPVWFRCYCSADPVVIVRSDRLGRSCGAGLRGREEQGRWGERCDRYGLASRVDKGWYAAEECGYTFIGVEHGAKSRKWYTPWRRKPSSTWSPTATLQPPLCAPDFETERVAHRTTPFTVHRAGACCSAACCVIVSTLRLGTEDPRTATGTRRVGRHRPTGWSRGSRQPVTLSRDQSRATRCRLSTLVARSK